MPPSSGKPKALAGIFTKRAARFTSLFRAGHYIIPFLCMLFTTPHVHVLQFPEQRVDPQYKPERVVRATTMQWAEFQALHGFVCDRHFALVFTF